MKWYLLLQEAFSRAYIIKNIPKSEILAFGFPCNDFSVVDKEKGFKGNYGPLYLCGVEALNIHNPKCFFAENVSGIQSANNGGSFKVILKDLQNAGKRQEAKRH